MLNGVAWNSFQLWEILKQKIHKKLACLYGVLINAAINYKFGVYL